MAVSVSPAATVTSEGGLGGEDTLGRDGAVTSDFDALARARANPEVYLLKRSADGDCPMTMVSAVGECSLMTFVLDAVLGNGEVDTTRVLEVAG
jgi:hypothetical protein